VDKEERIYNKDEAVDVHNDDGRWWRPWWRRQTDEEDNPDDKDYLDYLVK
jgi:hypothetical protein